jgi:copper transport protein
VRLNFSERPEPSLSEIRVLGPGGEPERVGAPRAGEDPLTLEAPLRRLARGVYTVDWKVFSAVDGHASEGSFAFGVRASPGLAAATGTSASQSSRFELLARWLFLLGALALIGGAVAGLARFGGTAGADLRLAAAGWALATLGLALLAEAQRLLAGSSFGALLETSVGEALVWRGAGLAAAGLALLVAWRRPRARRRAFALTLAAALLVVIAHVDTGHAAAADAATLAVAAQVAHFLAAGVWFGGLAALLLGFRGATATAREAALRRFGLAAFAALLVVFATGLLRAVEELVSWGDLLDSGYGRAVLAKLLLFALVAAIAVRNRPRRGGSGDSPGLRRRARLELLAAVAALALAALLGTLAPPSSAGTEAAGLTVSGADFGTTTRVELTTASSDPGPNLFTVRVEDYDSGDPVAARGVSLRFRPLDDPGVPSSSLRLRREAAGEYAGSGPNLGFDGRWAVDILVERGADPVAVPLELDLPVPEQFVSVLDIPGSPRPPQYTMQTGNGYIRLTPVPDRPGPARLYVHISTAFENSAPTDQLVVTAAAPDLSPHQLPVRRLGGSRFVAAAELVAGEMEIGVVARTRYGARVRGVFKVQIPS